MPLLASPPLRTQQLTATLPHTLDLRDFPQLMQSAALTLRNYFPLGAGRLAKCPGSQLTYRITSGTDAGSPLTAISTLPASFELLAYGHTLAIRDTLSTAITTLKNDFPRSDPFSIAPYGNYTYACNGSTHVGVITAQITYTSLVNTLPVGTLITGSTSHATATILATTGSSITLGDITGRFVGGENITGNNTPVGSAVLTSAITWCWTELTAAPKARVLSIVSSKRLACGNTDTSPSEIHVSGDDTLSGIPWSAASDWTPGSTVVAPFTLTFKNAGTVTGFGTLGKQIIALFDKGKLGFEIGSISVSGTGLVLDTPITFQNTDFGALQSIRVTSRGMYYANAYGIWLMNASSTSTAAGVSDSRLTEILGSDFGDMYDLSDCALEYDEIRDLLFVATRTRGSSVNNLLLVCSQKTGLTGWMTWDKCVKRWYKKDHTIYYSASNETALYQLDYYRGTDDTHDIATTFTYEWTGTGIADLHRLRDVSLTSELHPASTLAIDFTLITRTGALLPLGRTLVFNATDAPSSNHDGISRSHFRSSVRGQDIVPALLPSFTRARVASPDFSRLRMTITSYDGYPHVLNAAALTLEPRGKNHTENMSTSTS